MAHHAYGFVDGKYLRNEAENAGLCLVDPRNLCASIVQCNDIQNWCAPPNVAYNIALARVLYYDARPDDLADLNQELRDYWIAVELLPDTELGFGTIRGGTRRREPRHKGVDTLIAVDMLVGAFTGLFGVAILVAGDADFVPVVNEVRRRGAMVVVAGVTGSLSDDLRRAADRCDFLEVQPNSTLFPTLVVEGRSYDSASANRRSQLAVAPEPAQ